MAKLAESATRHDAALSQNVGGDQDLPQWDAPSWQMPLPNYNPGPRGLGQPVSNPTPRVESGDKPRVRKAAGPRRVETVTVEAVKFANTTELSADPDHVEEPELQDPTRFGIALSAINVALYSVMSLAQWVGWGGLYAVWAVHYTLLREAFAVLAINLVFGLLVVGGVFWLKPMQFPSRVRYPLIALVAMVAAIPRVLAMMTIYTMPTGSTFMVAEWMSGFLAGTIAVTAGVLTASLIGRARREHQRWINAAEKAQRAADELHTEEMRVRRMVADQLHGRLQYRLVTIAAGLDADAARLRDGGHELCSQSLADFANQLDLVREQEVRALSHAVYPAGIELGAVTAIKAMVHRLPPQITASVTTGPNLTKALECGSSVMPLAERLIAVFTIEEAVTNALKHGRATNLDISMELDDHSEPGMMVLKGRVDDDGVGLGIAKSELVSGKMTQADAGASGAKPTTSSAGLSRHSERLTSRGGYLNLSNRTNGGTRLEFALPFNSLFTLAEVEALPAA